VVHIADLVRARRPGRGPGTASAKHWRRGQPIKVRIEAAGSIGNRKGLLIQFLIASKLRVMDVGRTGSYCLVVATPGSRQSGPPSHRHPGRWDSVPEIVT
jgi:hypothetical protein